MFSVFSTPSCIHALFHILNSLEAQISIYLLLTVGQKHLKTPLFAYKYPSLTSESPISLCIV